MRELEPEYLIPLTHVEYHILTVLAERSLYGYAIMEQCEVDSEGLVSFGPGTLYPALKRLERFRFIERTQEEPSEGSPHSRQIYSLTHIGQMVLEQETGRLRRIVHLAEHRLQHPDKI